MSLKQLHKKWRKSFNELCLNRDNHKCVFCNETHNLNVHHIVDRHEMPNGGYSPFNGITVCETHHLECERFHMGEEVKSGFLPNELYEKIQSSYQKAYEDCLKLE